MIEKKGERLGNDCTKEGVSLPGDVSEEEGDKVFGIPYEEEERGAAEGRGFERNLSHSSISN